MMAKKDSKKNSKNNDSDLSALDSAVSELARQTEALLGKTGEKLKPTLPKKKPTSHASARSFDIIHAGDSTKKSAVLKSAPPEQKMLDALDEKLLPESSDTKITESGNAVPEIVTSHKSGSLKVSVDEPVEAEETDQAHTTNKPEKKAEKAKKSSARVAAKSEEQDILTDDSDTNEPEESVDAAPSDDAKNSKGKTEPDEQTEPSEDVAETDDTDSTDDVKVDAKPTVETDEKATSVMATDPQISPSQKPSDSTQNIQLYSDNLSKDQPTEAEGEAVEKTDLFDTDEYHPTLHDWSKLEHKSKGPILVLLVLTVLFALGVYAAMNGYVLPF